MQHCTSTSVVAAAGFAVVMAAQIASGAIYYVSPDGTGTGASWNDPAGFEAAYAAAGEAGGGELWLKKGTYHPVTGRAFASGVVVRGGFAGDETSAAEAKPDVNVTTFDAMIAKNTYCEYAFTNTADAVVSQFELHGLVFTNFGMSVLYAPVGTVRDAVISKCTVDGTRKADKTFAAVYVKNFSAAFRDCKFAHNVIGVKLLGGTNDFQRCDFTDNKLAPWCEGAPLHVVGSYGTNGKTANARATVSDCRFLRNWSNNHHSCATATGVLVEYAHVFVTNSLFEANIAHKDGGAGNCRGVILVNQTCSQLTMYGCAIRKNMALQSSQSAATCVQNASGFFAAENCVFSENIMSNTAAATTTTSYASVFGNYGASAASGQSYFVNCTIISNVAISVSGARVATICNDCTYGRNVCFANCMIADNVVTAADGVTPTYMADYVQVGTGTAHQDVFFNSVVKGRGASGQPFAVFNPATANLRLCFVRSAVYDYPDQVLAGVDTSYSQTDYTNELGKVVIPMDDAKLAGRFVRTSPAGVDQLGVATDSPFKKYGWSYWKGNDGNWWYRDDDSKGYTEGCRTINLTTIRYGGHITSYGFDPVNDPAYYDAVGSVRKQGRVCLGPLNPVPGMLLLLR